MRQIFLTLAAVILASGTAAHEPEIMGVTTTPTGHAWRVEVTILHSDTGWDHYVDGWEIQDKDGNRLGYRLLHHPHVNEQPFARALDHLSLPEDTQEIFVRAHCSVDGWSSAAVRVDLTR